MADITWRTDAVLAEALAIAGRRAGAGTGIAPHVWLESLINAMPRTAFQWGSIDATTMGADGAGMHMEPDGDMAFDLPCRITVTRGADTVTVRELPIGPATYCGLDLEGDALFRGPMLVVPLAGAIPDTVARGVAGSRLGEIVATGMPLLDARLVTEAWTDRGALWNARMDKKGSDQDALVLRLAAAGEVGIGMPSWAVPKDWPVAE